MSTLETQYQNYLKENPHSLLTYDEWLNYIWEPYISDDFQIGSDGAYEHTDEDHSKINEIEDE